jgi:hypothetical protein
MKLPDNYVPSKEELATVERVMTYFRDRLYRELEPHGIKPPKNWDEAETDPVLTLVRIMTDAAEKHLVGGLDNGLSQRVFMLGTLAEGYATFNMLLNRWSVDDLLDGLDN